MDLMTKCMYCHRKNCTMTNTGNCQFFMSEELPAWVIDTRNRRQRRLDERIAKKNKYKKL